MYIQDPMDRLLAKYENTAYITEMKRRENEKNTGFAEKNKLFEDKKND